MVARGDVSLLREGPVNGTASGHMAYCNPTGTVPAVDCGGSIREVMEMCLIARQTAGDGEEAGDWRRVISCEMDGLAARAADVRIRVLHAASDSRNHMRSPAE
ncbi:hypothetical protein TWF696_004237 [Orbilia brochopaga]|uniref:Uncharacterized protein n=1 Tax=Orbilia brochopaga TaxID=3140254 RepID=A0AAV9V6Q9_9PEZI